MSSYRFENITFCYQSMDMNQSSFENSIMSLNEKDLHIFISDENHLVDSAKVFSKIFSNRTLTNQEYWLLDISAWNSVEEAKELLDEVINNLDLNDDLYLYSLDDKSTNIWEYYRIHELRQSSLELLGEWNEFDGLKILQPEKWIRRANLEVGLISGYFYKFNQIGNVIFVFSGDTFQGSFYGSISNCLVETKGRNV